jgi:hypothetical protein
MTVTCSRVGGPLDCGSLLPLSLVSLLTNPVPTPQQAVATERQRAARSPRALASGGFSLVRYSLEHLLGEW